MCDRYTPKSIDFVMKNPKTKKILFIGLLALDIAITIFLFVVSILLLINMPTYTIEIANKPEFYRFFYQNEWAIPVIIVVPLFLLLGLNVLALFLYVKKTNANKKVKLNELSDAEKEALRKELMRDLAGGAAPAEPAKEEAPEAPKEEKKEE